MTRSFVLVIAISALFPAFVFADVMEERVERLERENAQLKEMITSLRQRLGLLEMRF